MVLLDDFCNIGFPGVSEALFLYLRSASNLVPVCSMSTKVVLTTVSYADVFRKFLFSSGTIPPTHRARRTVICGNDTYLIVDVSK